MKHAVTNTRAPTIQLKRYINEFKGLTGQANLDPKNVMGEILSSACISNSEDGGRIVPMVCVYHDAQDNGLPAATAASAKLHWSIQVASRTATCDNRSKGVFFSSSEKYFCCCCCFFVYYCCCCCCICSTITNLTGAQVMRTLLDGADTQLSLESVQILDLDLYSGKMYDYVFNMKVLVTVLCIMFSLYM